MFKPSAAPSRREQQRMEIEAENDRKFWAKMDAMRRLEDAVNAERKDHAAWLARQPESLSLAEMKRADNARFAGRSVQFLRDGMGGQYGTVTEAKRICRAGSDGIANGSLINFELTIRLSQVGRVDIDGVASPGMCVVVTLDDVKFID
jgi:hypothetical protein